MTIFLYELSADPRKVDKSGSLLQVTTIPGYDYQTGMSGTFKDKTDMIDPAIRLEISSDFIKDFNYIYISEWGRYYFVRHISVERSNLITVYCHVDVLYSYATEISGLSALVSRTETNYKPYLIDARRPFGKNVSRAVIDTTNTSHPFNPTFQELLGAYTIVVQCTNVNVSSIPSKAQPATPDPFSVLPNGSSMGKGGACSSYVMSKGELRSFIAKFFNANIAGDFDAFINSLAGNSLEGVTSLIAYPFNITGKDLLIKDNDNLYEDHTRAIEIYNHTIASQTAYQLLDNACYTVDFGTFSYTVSSFTDLEPYTKAQMYLPYVGMIDIPMSWLAGSGVNVKYKINMYTGDALVSIVSNDVSTYVHTETAHIGIHLPLTATNNVEQARNGFMNLLNGTMGILTNLNPVAGLMNLGRSLIETGFNTSKASTGAPTSEVSRMAKYDPYVLIEVQDDLTPANYGKFVGYPYEDIATLSSLSGYTVVEEVFGHMSLAQENEQSEIFALLKSGVIL